MTHTVDLADEKFLQQFEKFAIPPDEFDHRSHIRLAYIYLCEHDTTTTCHQVRQTLCDFLSHIGVEPATKYHETLTQAWVLAVRHFMTLTPNTQSAAEFIAANPQLLDTRILEAHYSQETLQSDAARTTFVEPDLAPIPKHEETVS